SITIGKGIPTIKGGLGTSWFGTFHSCSSLTHVTIPDNVTNIGDGVPTRGGIFGAFAVCSALTNVDLGARVAYIGNGAFAYCASLKKISIPDSVTTLGGFAFHNSGGLLDVKIGKGVTQLGPPIVYSFEYFTNLSPSR